LVPAVHEVLSLTYETIGGTLLSNAKLEDINPAYIPVRTKEKERKSQAPVKALARVAVDAILEKKGRDVLVLDVHAVSGIADLFILVTGDSDLQIRAIVDSVRERVKEQMAERPWHVEGADHYQWVLMDYVDLIIHVFSEEKRSFYSLERLWGDAPREEVQNELQADSVALLEDDELEDDELEDHELEDHEVETK